MSTAEGNSSNAASSPGDSPARRLATPVQFLRAVGPKRARLLRRLGLETASDVLFFFPRTYQDMSELRTIDRLVDDQPVSVCGTIDDIDVRGTGVGRSVLGVLIREGTQYVRAVWFNQPYMRDKFQVGRRVMLSGMARRRGARWEMAHPRVDFLAEDEEPPAGRVLPVYALTDGINQSLMRRIVHAAVEDFVELLDEAFPEEFLRQHELSPIQQALAEVHQPTGRSALATARHRFVYQELLVMQLALAMRRKRLQGECRAPRMETTAKIDARIRRRFPFELTQDQQSAVAEIAADMNRTRPMNRLLQGDVGSGKTVVAEYAMLLAVAHGRQAVLMAPTEVLARQHARTLTSNLAESRVRITLLTGGLPAGQRREALESIASGETDLVVGTHAVLQEAVQFKSLGLVIIDEQHKFGVRERMALRKSGLDPHYLVMTATPIPRTVSMTLYGDLDVSTLREGPPGRQNVYSYLGDEKRRDPWWDFFGRKLREGRQGYVITPLVDESSLLPLASVEQEFETLANGRLEAFRLDLVHGRQSTDEKEAAMEAFRRGETQVLVATSVVEVGVDVPNATLMTIENGERFGLAQLHQLRGRISRGIHPGYLCVFAEAPLRESRERLNAFCRSSDGFELAELDFQLRGPGDLFSSKQHGLPPLRIADPVRDESELEAARRDAQRLIEDDPDLTAPEFTRIRKMVLSRYGQALELGDVG